MDYTGGWKHYKSLLFLKDQFTSRRSSGNFGVTFPEPELDEDSAEEENANEYHLGESSEQNNIASPGNTVSSIPSLSGKSTFSLVTKRKSKDNVCDKLVQIEQEKLQYLQNKKKKLEGGGR